MTAPTRASLYAVVHLSVDGTPAAGRPGEPTPVGGARVPAEVVHGVFAAPWREISRRRLAPGASLGPRHLSDSEVMVFVHGGQGRAYTSDRDAIELTADTALTLLKGELLHLEADRGGEGLDLYLVEMGVRQRAGTS